MTGKLFIISAPSGSGKSTLVAHMMRRLGSEYPLELVITYTSKQPRPGEIDGRDYHFIAEEEFERRVDEGFFLEWSNAYGAYYGSPRSILDGIAQGRSYIMIIDRVGAQQIKKQYQDSILIWITTPSIEVLRQRLVARNTESPEQIERRMARAVQEIEQEKLFPLYSVYILNDFFEESVHKLTDFIKKNLTFFVTQNKEVKYFDKSL